METYFLYNGKRISRKGHVITAEFAVKKVCEMFPGIPEYKIRNIIYLQYHMWKDIIESGYFHNMKWEGVGAIVLKKRYYWLKINHVNIHRYTIGGVYSKRNLDHYGKKSPLLKEPRCLRYVDAQLNKGRCRRGTKRLWTKTIFKKFDELGQRYYVLDC